MKKRLLALLMATALCVGMAACGQKDPDPTPDDQQAAGGMTAGTYTASKLGMNGQVEVEVVVDETSIKSVKVTKNQETPGIGSPLVDGKQEGTIPTIAIPDAIVANQTVNVDAVAGATITSATIKAAVQDCLTQAGRPPLRRIPPPSPRTPTSSWWAAAAPVWLLPSPLPPRAPPSWWWRRTALWAATPWSAAPSTTTPIPSSRPRSP